MCQSFEQTDTAMSERQVIRIYFAVGANNTYAFLLRHFTLKNLGFFRY